LPEPQAVELPVTAVRLLRREATRGERRTLYA